MRPDRIVDLETALRLRKQMAVRTKWQLEQVALQLENMRRSRDYWRRMYEEEVSR